MGKLKYHLKNSISKRNIRKIGKKTIPISLMRKEDVKIIADRIDGRGDKKGIIFV